MHKIYPISAINLLFILILVVFGFPVNDASAQSEQQVDTSANENLEKELEQLLGKQVAAWNEGNLEKFMDTYWKSPKLTFSSGGKTNFGWQATLNNYQKAYPTPEKMGKLHFDELRVSKIEAHSALVLGHWHLRLVDGQQRDGNFTLVVMKFGNNRKIVHDHSSELKKLTEKEIDVQ